MNFLPQASGTRPRVACEITPQGIVAARSEVAGAPLSAVARVDLPIGALAPSLKPGNLVDRLAVVAALRRALEPMGLKAGTRTADITLIVPDGSVRVLLLEFDALSGKAAEALPIVRFRLKKLLPFDADDAMVTYQVMSSSRQIVRVLAVAMPKDVLAEYESVVREAGFEPGAVLPSTLAAIAALKDDGATLLVNAHTLGVTTAIVRSGIVLLHRSVDLQTHDAGTPANLPPALFEDTPTIALPLVDVEETASEWAAQEPLPEHGRNPYATPPEGIALPPAVVSRGLHHDTTSEEIAQAVSVAAAYFEDTLDTAPDRILSAGPLGADRLTRLLADHGLAQPNGGPAQPNGGPAQPNGGIAREEGLRVRDLVEPADILPEAVKSTVPRAWLSAVTGALRG